MSISLDLRNFRNPADKNRKYKDYMEYLKLQQKLNTNSDIAFKAMAKGQTLGITPQPAIKKYASSEEAVADVSEQRLTALNHLRTIFPYGEDATKALDFLDAYGPIGSKGTEIMVFNQNFNDFKSELKGKTNITLPFFNTIWDRYKEKLAKTAQTGIQIPIDDTTFNTRLRELETNILTSARDIFRLSARQREQLRQAVHQMVQNRDQTRLEALARAVELGNEEIIDRLTSMQEEPQQQGAPLTKTKALVEIRNMINKRGLNTANFKYVDSLGNTVETSTTKLRNSRGNTAEVIQVFNYLKGLAPEESKSERQTTPSPVRERLRQIVQNTPEQYKAVMETLRRNLGRNPTPQEVIDQFKTPGSSPVRQGSGVRMHERVWREAHRASSGAVFYGRGIQKSTEERFKEFGRYVIHIPSLKKSVLNLKFKSKGYIPSLPATHISEEFREMIEEILKTERLPYNLFNKLSKDEQRFFQKVAQKALIDDVLGVKVDNSEQREAMKRYEILKGELLAGNDNEQVRKELKGYILRFMNENLIPRKEGLEVLLELTAIG